MSDLAKEAGRDDEVLSAALEAIGPRNKDEKARNRSFRALMLLAESRPEVLLPRWGEIAALLKGGRAFSKYPAIHLLAALVPADKEGRFEMTFNAFYKLLDDEAISVAAHVAGLSGRIAKSRPGLQARITRKLLAIDETHFDAGRKDLIKSYAIQAFDEYLAEVDNPAAILGFVRMQLAAKSPKTRKTAKEFIKKWGAGDG